MSKTIFITSEDIRLAKEMRKKQANANKDLHKNTNKEGKNLWT